MASPSRRRALEALQVPTLVLHGTDDPLVPFASGEETARAIPGARLVALEGMGHLLPRPLWPQLADLVAEHAGVTRPSSVRG